jgi:hypothetical protein
MVQAEPRRYCLEVAGQALAVGEGHFAHCARRARESAAFRDAVTVLAGAQHRGAPLERAEVAVTLIRRRGQSPLDPANADRRAYEAVRALMEAGLLSSHSGAHFDVQVHQEQGKARATRVEVYESV